MNSPEDSKMKKVTKTRREALGMIGKTGIALGAVSYFFLSLRTFPENEKNSGTDRSRSPQNMTGAVQEKAVISGSGSKLTVTVSGKPGRHFFVAMAGSDNIEKYQRFPNSNGIINSRGKGSVVISTESIANSRIYLRIVTCDSGDFNSNLAQTEAFVISTKGGIIEAFEGLVSRPVIAPGINKITCAASIAAANAGNNKIQLR